MKMKLLVELTVPIQLELVGGPDRILFRRKTDFEFTPLTFAYFLKGRGAVRVDEWKGVVHDCWINNYSAESNTLTLRGGMLSGTYEYMKHLKDIGFVEDDKIRQSIGDKLPISGAAQEEWDSRKKTMVILIKRP